MVSPGFGAASDRFVRPPSPTRGSAHRPGVGWATTSGHRRDHNEDVVLAGPHWFAVADGMGGHNAGDVAATMAIDVLAGHARPIATITAVRAAVRDASMHVHRSACGPRAGMGTTVVGVAPLRGGRVAVFHAGDSRCYRLHAGGLALVTTDHTHVQELVDAGLLTSAEAERHPRRNVVTRALGLAPDVHPDVSVLHAPVGRLLLCSDGVSGQLPARTIGRVLAGVADPGAAARRLIDLVLAGSAPDNATALVLDLVPGRAAAA